jgi:hypothetical protein
MNSARPHPHTARSHPYSARSHPYSARSHTHLARSQPHSVKISSKLGYRSHPHSARSHPHSARSHSHIYLRFLYTNLTVRFLAFISISGRNNYCRKVRGNAWTQKIRQIFSLQYYSPFYLLSLHLILYPLCFSVFLTYFQFSSLCISLLCMIVSLFSLL